MRLQLPLGDTLKEPGFFILVFFAPGYAYFSLLSTTKLIFLLFYFNPFSECCDTKLFWKSRLSWEVSNHPQEKNLLLGSNPGHPFQFSITHWAFQFLDKRRCFAMTFHQKYKSVLCQLSRSRQMSDISEFSKTWHGSGIFFADTKRPKINGCREKSSKIKSPIY